MLPVRPPAQNNVDVLMAELEKLGQSDGEDELPGGVKDKRSILLSEPVIITITCLSPPNGAGRGPRFYPHQHYGYNERQRIKIPDYEDNYCLFHALVAARAYHDNLATLAKHRESRKAKGRTTPTEMPVTENVVKEMPIIADLMAHSKMLDYLIDDKERMCNAVNQLMREAGIEQGLDAYGVAHLRIVQDYWVIYYITSIFYMLLPLLSGPKVSGHVQNCVV